MKRRAFAATRTRRSCNRLLSVWIILVLLSVCLTPAAAGELYEPPHPAPAAPLDLGWASGFNVPGMQGSVYALVSGLDGSLYAGGGFSAACGTLVNSIAYRDGSQWHALTSGVGGADPWVFALALDQGSSLYAGGLFTIAGGVAANYVARWDETTSTWHPLSSGTNEGVYALALGPDGSLYAGGAFTSAGGITARAIARWDEPTSSWHPVGGGMTGGSNSTVEALAIGPDGSLYAGGRFTGAGGVAANNVARWDGSQWHPLGDGMTGGSYVLVEALAIGPDGSLYAGGRFTSAGGVVVNNIARWDQSTSSWQPLGSGMTGWSYPAVHALAFGPDGLLYAGGSFTSAGGVAANNVARWDGAAASWRPLGDGTGDGIESLAFDPGGSLYAGGYPGSAGGVATSGIARWDNATSSWHALCEGDGMGGDVRALALGPDENVCAGGGFGTAGHAIASRIACWDGSQWRPLGSGMAGAPYVSPDVLALVLGQDGSLYAGGSFTSAGGVAANYIASWDETTSSWRPLGSGMAGGSFPAVFALAIGPDGSLYAGGSFTSAGGVAANNIARWDGSQWQPLGGGMTGGSFVVVYALAVGPDGSLYAGGVFTSAGGVSANHIARWDGTTWHPLGAGIAAGSYNTFVAALATSPDGSLYAAGDFTTAGGVAANNIARWDGATLAWHPLDSGMNAYVQALAVAPDGALYAGGNFSQAGSVEANRIARWDGSQWRALESGMNYEVLALATDPGGSLHAGGSFTTAGGKSSSYIARWGELPPTAVTLASFDVEDGRGAAPPAWPIALMLGLAFVASVLWQAGVTRPFEADGDGDGDLAALGID